MYRARGTYMHRDTVRRRVIVVNRCRCRLQCGEWCVIRPSTPIFETSRRRQAVFRACQTRQPTSHWCGQRATTHSFVLLFFLLSIISPEAILQISPATSHPDSNLSQKPLNNLLYSASPTPYRVVRLRYCCCPRAVRHTCIRSTPRPTKRQARLDFY